MQSPDFDLVSRCASGPRRKRPHRNRKLFAVREVLVHLSGYSFPNHPLGETSEIEYSEIKQNGDNLRSRNLHRSHSKPSAPFHTRLHYFGGKWARGAALTILGADPHRRILDFDRTLTTEEACPTRRGGFRRVGTTIPADGFFTESLSCDPAHAQFSFPRFIDHQRNKMREQEVSSEAPWRSSLEWRKRNKIDEWASPHQEVSWRYFRCRIRPCRNRHSGSCWSAPAPSHKTPEPHAKMIVGNH